MKLFDYLDQEYKSKNLSLQIDYNHQTKGETQAVMTLIKWQRNYFEFIGIFKLLFGYLKKRFTHDELVETKDVSTDAEKPIQETTKEVVSQA